MFSLTDPPPQQLARFLADQREREFSYAQVGWSREAMAPPGAFVNQGSSVIGRGRADYDRACRALLAWRMMPHGWLRIDPPGAAIEPAAIVATVARGPGLWTVNACRIVYVSDSEDPRGGSDAAVDDLTPPTGRTPASASRGDRPKPGDIVQQSGGQIRRPSGASVRRHTSLAFGYGTLKGHLMAGEERFRVSLNPDDESVSYDVWSFSWPNTWQAYCALPLIRRVQRRFARESPLAMQSALLD